MPGYRWINHSWLYDPILYLLSKYTGFFGIAIAGAIVSFSIFLISTLPYKLKLWQKALLGYFYFQLTSGVFWQGLRSQMVSELMLSILLLFLIKVKQAAQFDGQIVSMRRIVGKGLGLYSILFFCTFLLWANLHGSFVFGLVIIGAFAFSELFQKSENLKKAFDFRVSKRFFVYVELFVVGGIASLINPWGYEVYLEAIRHSSSPLLKYILEWDPVQISSSFFLIFLIYSIIFVSIFAIRRRISDLPFLLTLLISGYLALNARRYMALFAVVNLPYLAYALHSFKFDLSRFKATSYILFVVIVVAYEIVLFRALPSYHLYKLWNYSVDDYCALGSGCSQTMVDYLIKNPPQGKGFNFYDIGGFLIGEGVPVKLFIDGRMHLWEGPDHYQIFLEYEKIYYERDINRFKKYNFDWMLIQRSSSLFEATQKNNTLGKWEVVIQSGDIVYMVRDRAADKGKK